MRCASCNKKFESTDWVMHPATQDWDDLCSKCRLDVDILVQELEELSKDVRNKEQNK
jgi:hypothetical protein